MKEEYGHSCMNCTAKFNVDAEQDDDFETVEYCPFCGSEIFNYDYEEDDKADEEFDVED